jgi:glycosyltransferase involved in cell wall biosynthesis
VIFESGFARQAFHRLVGKPRCPDPVIHNGLRPEEFEPLEPADDAADFVFVGELRELKGVRVLLEALARVRRTDARPARLLMVGDGPDAAGFRALVEDLGLSGQVEMPGAQPARQALRRGRCAVVPSLAESLPYVVMEAAAAGLPVIATRVGGIPEIFGPTAESLVPAGDAEALAGRMQDFLAQPERWRAEAERRLLHIREQFSLSRMVDAIEAVYRRALSQH